MHCVRFPHQNSPRLHASCTSPAPRLEESFGMLELWEVPSWVATVLDTTVSPAVFRDQNFTLWQLGNEYIRCAREVQSNHYSWVAANGPAALADTPEWNFVNENNELLYQAYGQVLDNMVLRAVASVEVGTCRLTNDGPALPLLDFSACSAARPPNTGRSLHVLKFSILPALPYHSTDASAYPPRALLSHNLHSFPLPGSESQPDEHRSAGGGGLRAVRGGAVLHQLPAGRRGHAALQRLCSVSQHTRWLPARTGYQELPGALVPLGVDPCRALPCQQQCSNCADCWSIDNVISWVFLHSQIEDTDDEDEEDAEVVMLRDVQGGANANKQASKGKEATEAADTKANASRAGAIASGGKRVSMAGHPSSIGGSAVGGVAAGDLLLPAHSGVAAASMQSKAVQWVVNNLKRAGAHAIWLHDVHYRSGASTLRVNLEFKASWRVKMHNTSHTSDAPPLRCTTASSKPLDDANCKFHVPYLLPPGSRLFAQRGSINVGRKRLLRNGRDGTRLAAPFMLWGALVIIIYAASYAMLLEEGVLLVSAVNCFLVIAFRSGRVVVAGLAAAHRMAPKKGCNTTESAILHA